MRKLRSLVALCFFATLCLLSCTDDDAPVDPNIITQEYYFQAVLDGDTVTYQDQLNDYTNIAGDFLGAQSTIDFLYCPYTCIAKNAAATNPIPSLLANSGTVGIVKMSTTEATTLELYTDLITTGALPVGYFRQDSSQTGADGAFIRIFDADGVEWNTNNGPVSNGSIVVTEYNTFIDNTRTPATQRVVAATFTNILVYNANGQSKTVTNGKVRGRIILWP